MAIKAEIPKAGLSDWIAKNLWAILALIGGIAQGYNVGTSAMTDQAKRTDALEAARKQDDAFHHCIVRTVDWLKAKSEGPAPCELE